MRVQSKDTDINAEKMLISLMRRATLPQKFAHIRSLSETMLSLSQRAIFRKNSHLEDLDYQWLFIKYHYGKELADRYKKILKNKAQ